MGTDLVPRLGRSVNDARIAPDRYVEIITAAALGALGAPVTPPPGLPDSR
jgi:hypothetical protein